ncbi:hypothetical protein ACHAQJ_006922 [Trichoderma viride]
MASTPLYAESHNNLTGLLQEGAQLKQYVSTVATNYAERVVNASKDFSNLSPPSECNFLISSKTDDYATPNLKVNDDEVIAEEDAFKEAMRLYESTANAEYRTGIDPDDEHTAAQLESLVEESIKRYQKNDSKGFWGKIRLACRKLGENKDNIEGWLGVLPSENQYLSVVCGGLMLIVKAAARLNDIREKVLESLESIPTLISNAQRVSIIYAESNKLKALSKAFYASILTALGHILKYLNDRAKVSRSSMKVLKAVALSSSFDKELRGKIENVEKCVGAFEAEANLCQKEQIHQAKQNIDAAMSGINEVKQTIVYAATGQKEVNRDMVEIMMGIKRKQSDLGRDVSNLKSTLMERIMEFFQSGDAVQLYAQMMVQPIPTTHEQLLSQLHSDQRAVRFDMTSIYELGPKLSRDNQERSMFLIKAPKLTAWMESEHSAVLLVNGNTRRAERQSGLTFVCARLAFAFEGIRSSAESTHANWPRILPLYFFCGEHASCDYSWETPSGVLDSILGQLLTHMKSNGLSLDLAKVTTLDKSNQKGVKEAFQCFKQVLAQLPANTTVFCIIDALSVYLNDNRTAQDAEQLMHRLLKLVLAKKHKNRCVFKLLLTAPKRLHSREVDGLGEENVITLPPTLPNKGGFTATKWHYSISQQLESLEEVT